MDCKRIKLDSRIKTRLLAGAALLVLPTLCATRTYASANAEDNRQGSTQSKKASVQNSDADKLKFEWHRSLPVDERTTTTGAIGGTEARSLVAMDGKLYASIGYWSDNQENNPNLPGGQVLVLDAPTSKWKVDLNLDERMTSGGATGKRRYFAIAMLYAATFKSDKDGKPLAKPKKMLLAGAWDRMGKLEVFSKAEGGGTWQKSEIQIPSNSASHHAEIRSFIVYKDKVTNIEHAFAGARINSVDNATRIYSGALDATSGKLLWSETAESWDEGSPDLTRTTHASGRITAMAECRGKLYASVYNNIFERQDGANPTWKHVYTFTPDKPFGVGSSGFRGLTAIGDKLYFTVEHNPCTMIALDPTDFKGKSEINISAFLTEKLGTTVRYVLAGYNDMLSYKDPQTGEPLTLLGFEGGMPLSRTKFHHFGGEARFLIRDSKGKFFVQEIVDHSLDYKPNLVSVRTIINSPFAQDPPGTLYAGGFDCNHIPVHNTAWVYRGVRVK